MENIKIWTGEVEGYQLLDSGNKKKLEEIGGIRIVRDEPRAWWGRKLESEKWKGASKELETILDIGIGGVRAKIKFNEKSKHIGIFPEQKSQWEWVDKKLKDSKIERLKDPEKYKEIKVLNLFGYTGIASLVAASTGLPREASAEWSLKVTHVDASKQSVDWARENQKLSGLEGAPIRWIVDDAIKFLKREIKRGEKYDAIIMDPPSYGRGPKGEVWKIEEKLSDLLAACREVLSDKPLFVIFNMYSTELSSISAGNLLSDITKNLDGNLEIGELAIKSDKLLPMSIFAIWSAK